MTEHDKKYRPPVKDKPLEESCFEKAKTRALTCCKKEEKSDTGSVVESLKHSPDIPRKAPIPEQDYVVRRVEAQPIIEKPIIEQPVRTETPPVEIIKQEEFVNQAGVIHY